MEEKKTRETYTRITNILYPFSGLEKIDPSIVEKAANRGTKVHKICEGIIMGLGEIGVEEDTKNYVESFKKWWNLGHKVVMLEQRFWDDKLQITGQVDIILNTEKGLAIVDLKTSYRPSPTWKAQGCAYAYLARLAGHDIKKIYFIHLSKKGLHPHIYEYEVDDSFFLNIYRAWESFFKKE